MKQFDFKDAYEKTIVGNCFVEERVGSVKQTAVIKRFFDIVFSVLCVLIFFIPSLIIAFLVKLTSRGPVFFLQDRLGQNGKTFKIIKFRTMNVDAEDVCGPVWAQEDDPRGTKLGRYLRKLHFDEIPQFINVLKGDMSIVGPRPEREFFYKEFSGYIDGFEQRLLVPQGLTGYAQVMGGYDLKPEKKIVYDLYYIKNQSLCMDISIILYTIKNILFKHKDNEKES